MDAMVYIALAKLFSIAGIGGFLSGVLIRRFTGALMGGFVAGVLSMLIIASNRGSDTAAVSWMITIGIGLTMASLGWLARRYFSK